MKEDLERSKRLLERFEKEMARYDSLDGYSLYGKNAPDGGIYYSVNTNVYDEDGKRLRHYIGNVENDFVYSLKMHRFLKKSIEKLRTNIRCLNRYLNKYSEVDPNEFQRTWAAVYHKLPEKCFDLSETMNVGEWKERFLERHTLPNPTYPQDLTVRTKDGSWVRSKSEAFIYNMLLDEHLAFCYEHPLKINGSDVRPDFYVLSERDHKFYVWEHLGMLEKPDYLRKTFWKLQQYQADDFVLGGDLIISYDYGNNGFDTAEIYDMVHRYLLPR